MFTTTPGIVTRNQEDKVIKLHDRGGSSIMWCYFWDGGAECEKLFSLDMSGMNE